MSGTFKKKGFIFISTLPFKEMKKEKIIICQELDQDYIYSVATGRKIFVVKEYQGKFARI